MRELAIPETKAVCGAQLPTSGTQTYQLGGAGALTVDWTSVNAGLAEFKTGLSQIKAGNTTQGGNTVLAGVNEILADISFTPATTTT